MIVMLVNEFIIYSQIGTGYKLMLGKILIVLVYRNYVLLVMTNLLSFHLRSMKRSCLYWRILNHYLRPMITNWCGTFFIVC